MKDEKSINSFVIITKLLFAKLTPLEKYTLDLNYPTAIFAIFFHKKGGILFSSSHVILIG